MTTIQRRAFLQGGAALTGGALLGGPFQGFISRAAGAAPLRPTGYGPLAAVRDHRDGVVRLELPEGFQYRSFHPAGTPLGDGTRVPGRHDGMAAFPGRRRNTSILVRNHEVNGPVGAFGDPDLAYDPLTGGGTTTVEVDRHGKVLDSWVSCNGTQMNCAGGRMPWGSWITCEETVNGNDVGPDFTGASNARLRPHGYIYEVPAGGQSDRVPIKRAGRFAHEAAAYAHGAVYLTEDNFAFPSGFYRYLPPSDPVQGGRLEDGGTLQMLAVEGTDDIDLSAPQQAGTTHPVRWITIPEPDPTFPKGTTNDQAISAVGDQGRDLGAAVFSRLEGAVTNRGIVYFVSTQGGARAQGDSDPSGFGAGRGQVWAYDAGAERLHLVYESPSASVLDLPDNVTASATGSLVLCEDGSEDNYLRGLTTGGDLFDFARNADADQVGQEFAGATFSPDFKTLYVNVQSGTGYSIAVWGPWARGPF